jgi:hypothetical protein
MLREASVLVERKSVCEEDEEWLKTYGGNGMFGCRGRHLRRSWRRRVTRGVGSYSRSLGCNQQCRGNQPVRNTVPCVAYG